MSELCQVDAKHDSNSSKSLIGVIINHEIVRDRACFFFHVARVPDGAECPWVRPYRYRVLATLKPCSQRRSESERGIDDFTGALRINEAPLTVRVERGLDAGPLRQAEEWAPRPRPVRPDSGRPVAHGTRAERPCRSMSGIVFFGPLRRF